MTPEALAQLATLAEARESRDLAALEALLAEDRSLAAEIAEARAQGIRDHEGGTVALPFALLARRQALADQRIAAADQRRRELAPKIAAARDVAARSLGKHEAVKTLLDAARRDRLAHLSAKAERES